MIGARGSEFVRWREETLRGEVAFGSSLHRLSVHEPGKKIFKQRAANAFWTQERMTSTTTPGPCVFWVFPPFWGGRWAESMSLPNVGRSFLLLAFFFGGWVPSFSLFTGKNVNLVRKVCFKLETSLVVWVWGWFRVVPASLKPSLVQGWFRMGFAF